MAPRLVLHRVTVSADEQYFFLARPDTYAGDIGTTCGISKATDTEQDRPPTKVAALVSNGKLFRLAASYTVGTKKRTVKLLCSKAKLGDVFDALDGKTYSGASGSGTLSAVRVTQKAIYF